MAYEAARMKKTYSPILVAIIVLVIFALPCSSFSAQSIYTIQLGSYLSMKGANKHFDMILKKLNPQDRSTLRIEKIGKYYALRLGVFENFKEEAERFFRKVKAVNPGAIILIAKPGKRKVVGIVDVTTVEGGLVTPVETVHTPVETVYTPVETVHTPVETVHTPVETVHTPVETVHTPVETVHTPVETVAESEAIVSLSEPEPPAEYRETESKIVPSVVLKPQNLRAQAPVAVRESQPLNPDSLLIGFTMIIVFFMFEHYILALDRLGRYENLKRRFTGLAAVKWFTESKSVELLDQREKLQVGFETGSITPDVYIVGNYSVLADELHEELSNEVVKNEAEEISQEIGRNSLSDLLNKVGLAEYGDFALDEGRISTDDEVLTAAEEVTEIKLEVPESRNLHTVVPRPGPRKGQVGGGADTKIGSSEKAERENRVARAVLAVSFFGEE